MYDVNGPLNIRGTICSLGTVDLIWKISRLREDPHRSLPKLIDILAESRLCMSTYAIDKVYGVLGLVCKEDAEGIPVDYGIEAADLYQRIAETELWKTGLEILYHCANSGDSSTVGCPSWTPDWSQPCYHTSYAKLGYKSSAAGASKARFRVVGDTLTVKGRIVDSIQAVELLRAIPTRFDPKINEPTDREAAIPAAPEMKPGEENTLVPADGKTDAEMNNNVLNHRSWFPNVMRIAFPDNVITAESYEVLWRTCCCNKTTDGDIPGVDFADSFGDWTKAMMGLKLRDFEEFQRKARRFMESFMLYCDNRRFFRCKDGMLGWGPDQVREGDAICVLDGASVPFVLRPVEGGRFKVVGDAYVSGIMDGEAMELVVEDMDILLV